MGPNNLLNSNYHKPSDLHRAKADREGVSLFMWKEQRKPPTLSIHQNSWSVKSTNLLKYKSEEWMECSLIYETPTIFASKENYVINTTYLLI